MIPSYLRLPTDLPPRLRSNILHYYFDIAWWGLYAGATMAFLTIYAARIGATPTQIGLLSALPSGLALLISLPVGNLVHRLGGHRATVIGALFSRLPLLLYALLPFWLDQPAQINTILAIGIFLAIPNTIIGIGFPQLMLQAITPEWRGSVVGVRNAFFSILTFLTTMVSGQILTHMAFPAGYQVIFVIGFIGGIATAYHLYKVRPLEDGLSTGSQESLLSQTTRRMPGYLPALTEPGRHFLRVLAILFLFNATNNMVAPLIPGVLVNDLRLSDGWISAGTAANSLIVFVVSLSIARLTHRTGNRAATAIGAALLAGQTLALSLATGAGGYLVAVAVGGIGSGILITSQFNYHLDNLPSEDRSTWLSWSLMLSNAALLIGSLIGPLLAGWTDTPTALTVLSLLRIVAAMLFLRLG